MYLWKNKPAILAEVVLSIIRTQILTNKKWYIFDLNRNIFSTPLVRDRLRQEARDLDRLLDEPAPLTQLPADIKRARRFVAIARKLDIVQAKLVGNTTDREK